MPPSTVDVRSGRRSHEVGTLYSYILEIATVVFDSLALALYIFLTESVFITLETSCKQHNLRLLA